jgi:hypothetical protein
MWEAAEVVWSFLFEDVLLSSVNRIAVTNSLDPLGNAISTDKSSTHEIFWQ